MLWHCDTILTFLSDPLELWSNVFLIEAWDRNRFSCKFTFVSIVHKCNVSTVFYSLKLITFISRRNSTVRQKILILKSWYDETGFEAPRMKHNWNWNSMSAKYVVYEVIAFYDEFYRWLNCCFRKLMVFSIGHRKSPFYSFMGKYVCLIVTY